MLEAAAQAFAELGPDVSVDEIARRAGVGHGTVFRRFPTKGALMAAVLAARIDELGDRAEQLLGEADAAAALDDFVWLAAEACASNRSLFEGVPLCEGFPEVAAAKERLEGFVHELLRRAQESGKLRPDVGAQDVSALVSAAIFAADRAGSTGAWRRYIAVVLAGLRKNP